MSLKKVLSVRVFAGVASVTVRRPAAVVLWLLHSAPLLLEQRVRLAVLPFSCLAHQSLVCVHLAKCVPKNKRVLDWTRQAVGQQHNNNTNNTPAPCVLCQLAKRTGLLEQ